MVEVKINKADLKSLKNKLKELNQISQKEFANEIGKTANDSRNRMLRHVPVDTGQLKGSISTVLAGKKATLKAKKKYAPYVEFGTGKEVDLDDMLEIGLPSSYAAKFKGKGIKEVNLPARPFFFNSIRVEFRKLLNRLEDRLKKATR